MTIVSEGCEDQSNSDRSVVKVDEYDGSMASVKLEDISSDEKTTVDWDGTQDWCTMTFEEIKQTLKFEERPNCK